MKDPEPGRKVSGDDHMDGSGESRRLEMQWKEAALVVLMATEEI